MRLKQKTYGFTLLEMVIAMILAVIIIALAYKAITMINKEWTIFKTKQDKNTAILLLKQTLDADIERAWYITYRGNKVFGIVTGDSTVLWKLDTVVLRKQSGQTDTFHVSIGIKDCSFIKLVNGDSVVRKLYCHITAPMDIKHVIFEKFYTSENLMSIQ